EDKRKESGSDATSSSTFIPAMSPDGWSPQLRTRSWRKTSLTTPSTATATNRIPSTPTVEARWSPNQYQNSSSISASSDPTLDPAHQTTTPIPKHSSKP